MLLRGRKKQKQKQKHLSSTLVGSIWEQTINSQISCLGACSGAFFFFLTFSALTGSGTLPSLQSVTGGKTRQHSSRLINTAPIFHTGKPRTTGILFFILILPVIRLHSWVLFYLFARPVVRTDTRIEATINRGKENTLKHTKD